MTRTAEILGSEYDAPAQLPERLAHYEPKRDLSLAALKRAEAAGDAAAVEVTYWELGLLDLWLSPTKGASPYVGGTYEAYAEAYRISESTVAYSRERANETRDVILKLHYLTFVLLRSEPRGRTWIELQRELLTSYREYVSGCILLPRRLVDGDVSTLVDGHAARMESPHLVMEWAGRQATGS